MNLEHRLHRYQETAADDGGGDPAPAGGEKPAGDEGKPGNQPGGVMSGAEDKGAWFYAEGVPGEGDRPDFLDPKFKSLAEQAKGYKDLASAQGKFGSYFGAPEGDYELSLPEGVEGEFDTDNAMLKSFTEQAKDMGLSQAAFDKLLHTYVEHDAGLVANQAANVAQVAQELGENGEAIIKDTWQRLNATLGEEDAKALDQVATSAPAIRAIGKLLGSEASLPTGDGGSQGKLSRDDLRAMRHATFEDGPRKGQPKYGNDKEYTQKIDRLYEENFPGRDVQEV